MRRANVRGRRFRRRGAAPSLFVHRLVGARGCLSARPPARSQTSRRAPRHPSRISADDPRATCPVNPPDHGIKHLACGRPILTVGPIRKLFIFQPFRSWLPLQDSNRLVGELGRNHPEPRPAEALPVPRVARRYSWADTRCNVSGSELSYAVAPAAYADSPAPSREVGSRTGSVLHAPRIRTGSLSVAHPLGVASELPSSGPFG